MCDVNTDPAGACSDKVTIIVSIYTRVLIIHTISPAIHMAGAPTTMTSDHDGKVQLIILYSLSPALPAL